MTDKVTTIPEFNPSGDEKVTTIKKATEELIIYIQDKVPDGRRRSIALTNYEQAAMWAVKACFRLTSARNYWVEAGDLDKGVSTHLYRKQPEEPGHWVEVEVAIIPAQRKIEITWGQYAE